MKTWLVLAATSFWLAATSAGLPGDTHSTTAMQWQRWEQVLTAEKELRQAYSAIEVDVRFTGPDGATLHAPAFWNGDREFCIRMAFPKPGVWHWRTTCNDAADAGLHGQTGEVQVSAYAGENRLFRHGDLRVSADKRYLVHSDGTPFLWMGDTGWNAAWKSTTAEWRDYVDARARQRFSVVQVVATGTVARNSTIRPASGHVPFTADGAPNHPFWRDLEEKVAFANDRGLIVLLTGVGKSPAGFAEQQRSRAFVRYLVGRLAGHIVIFSPSMDQRFDPENEESGTRLRALTTHLVTQHPGTHFETARLYHDAAYADFCGLQTGHHGGNLERAYTAAREWTLELWQRPPVKPVINIEAMYDAHGHDNARNWREQDARKLGWITWLSGSRGYTYGAGDVPPKVPAGAGGVWRFNTDADAYDHWRKALDWPSAAQMTHLRDFFAGIEWWRLEPTPELVKNQAEEAPRKMVVSRSAKGDLLVAYLPDNAEIVLDLKGMRGDLMGRWFNPVSGRSVPVAEGVSTQTVATLRRPADWTDAVLILATPKVAGAASADKPLAGQIVIDPQHPRWLKRHEGRHVFICGPGDPEDFLYAGQRKADGTRDGDQMARIEKLAEHGGNCIYIQLVRTHGGDARPDRTQNPFVDSDPAKGLDEDILKQWDGWFGRLDRHNILIYLFFYDDSARIWNTGDRVGPEERAFVETIVKRYKHLKNLIWVIGEESEERYSTARVQAIAQIIQDADDHGHLIGDHHQSGTTFKAWQEGGALHHFAMQLSETDDAAHAGAIEALRKADGRYQVIYSESTAMRTDVDGMRSHAWAVAMGGLMPMLLRMDIATTPPEALQQCRHLQRFFEGTDFWTMSPHDGHKYGDTKYVLADPGRSYIVYGNQVTEKLGLKGLPAGQYAVHWVDCRSGETADASQALTSAGDATFAKPTRFGPECAAWIRPNAGAGEGNRSPLGSAGPKRLYPHPHWPLIDDVQSVVTSPERLHSYRQWLAGRCGDSWAAVVVKSGYLVFEGRGPRCHITQRNDCGSIKKSLQATVLGAALQQGKLTSLDENALPYWKDPFVTKFENDQRITFRQFATYQDRWNDPAPPGTFRYNNSGAVAGGACIAGLFGQVSGARPHGIAEAARREVMKRIGADWDLWYWEQDFTGNLSNPGPRMVLEASAYELAKLGYLWLRRGKWQDATIFSEDFYREATTDWSPNSGSTQNGFIGHYGYWWFVNQRLALLPEAPADTFYHIGNGHPKRATGLLIIPSLDTVAVLSMERLSDDGKWDVIQNSRAVSNDGMRQWSAQVVKLHGR